MKKDSITFRLAPDKRKTLDILAEQVQQPRSALLQEAVENYLELQAWQLAHIEEGLRQAQAGEFVPDEEVEAFFERMKQ